jgi:hypothetical protein
MAQLQNTQIKNTINNNKARAANPISIIIERTLLAAFTFAPWEASS